MARIQPAPAPKTTQCFYCRAELSVARVPVLACCPKCGRPLLVIANDAGLKPEFAGSAVSEKKIKKETAA